jgi:hypothetical protein
MVSRYMATDGSFLEDMENKLPLESLLFSSNLQNKQ